MLTLIAVMALVTASASGADAPGGPKPLPHKYNPFGTEGATTPEMLAALNRMSESCVVEGRRGSLGHFRWSGTPPKLTHLGLWGAAVTNEIVALSSALPDLEFVSVYETSLDDDGVQALSRLPKLRYLAITLIDRYTKPGFGAPQWSYPFIAPKPDRPRVTGTGLRALTTITTLEGLDLLDVQMSPADLAALSAWPKLGSLSLSNVIDEAAVKHLQACRRLNNLTLGNRVIDANELVALSAWKGLRKLTLIHASLSDEALRALSRLDTIQTIELIDCGLTDERLQHLHGSEKLSHLVVQRNEINGPGLVHLAKLKLKSLHLGFNNLSDDTLRLLPQLDSLDELLIPYCRGVTDQGIRSGILQGMTWLKKLELRGLTQVTDASLDDLIKFGHLTNLGIRETKTSPQAVDKMKSAMPMTVVFK